MILNITTGVSDIAISGEDNEMTNLKHTTSKLQTSSNKSNSRRRICRDSSLELGAWSFSGAWKLEFGALVRSCLALTLALALSPLSSKAQTNTVAPGTNGNRYLLLVETSRAMQRRSAGMLAAVQGLLESSMGGQLRRGDTLGIWTYNKQLYAGQFPLQQWSPEAQRTVASRVLGFLRERTYENSAALPVVMPVLDRVIKQSPFLTVILISDGEQKIHGTPFDAAINKSYDAWEKEQQKARMPLLTILRAQAGRLNAYSVNAAPWPVEMPPLPKELLEAKVQKKEAAPPAPAPKPPPPRGPSLYLSGKKTQPTESSNSPALLATNAPAVATPTNSSAPRSESPSATNPAPASGLVKPRSDASAPATRTAQELPATADDPAPTTHAAADGDKPIPSPTSAPASVTPVSPVGSAVPAPKAEPAKLASSTASSDSNPSSAVNPPSSILGDTTASSQSPAASPESPISSVQYPVSGLRIWMLAGPVLAGGAILVLVWLRRSRSSRHISLITRSFDREKP